MTRDRGDRPVKGTGRIGSPGSGRGDRSLARAFKTVGLVATLVPTSIDSSSGKTLATGSRLPPFASSSLLELGRCSLLSFFPLRQLRIRRFSPRANERIRIESGCDVVHQPLSRIGSWLINGNLRQLESQ